MKAHDLRKQFIDFFSKNQTYPHAILTSSSLVPTQDTSVLFTTAGMQQLKPYFLGGKKQAQKDLKQTRFTSSQKCFRVSDIDEVGDDSHCTFFEMLGNFSVGDYFSDVAIPLAWEFVSKKLHLSSERLWVTYFAGDKELAIQEDSETKNIWMRSGVQEKHISANGKEDNFWGPPGPEGPCGPCTELHYDQTLVPCEKKDACKPNCNCGRFVEIWNIVLMRFEKNAKGEYLELKQKNIDTGMGLERVAMLLEKKPNVFATSLFAPLIEKIKKDPAFSVVNTIEERRVRIIADHLRASVFLLAEGVRFGKKQQEAVLRRIFRKAIDQFGSVSVVIEPYVTHIIDAYKDVYPELAKESENIHQACNEEFASIKKMQQRSISNYLAKIRGEKETQEPLQGPSTRLLTPDEVFTLLTTFGFTLDVITRDGYLFDSEEVTKRIEAHKDISRQGAEKKFGGHGLSSVNQSSVSENERNAITSHHTATHLLHAALRLHLGDAVRQEGSDITADRLRFDFSFPEKLSQDQKTVIEKQINDWINGGFIVVKDEMPIQLALSQGAMAFFREKYPEKVSVYSIIHPKTQQTISKELCGGPHVKELKEIGIFSIDSEKSVAKGIRRIKAHVDLKVS